MYHRQQARGLVWYLGDRRAHLRRLLPNPKLHAHSRPRVALARLPASSRRDLASDLDREVAQTHGFSTTLTRVMFTAPVAAPPGTDSWTEIIGCFAYAAPRREL